MIVLDANPLLYAYDSISAHHKKARRWLEKTLSSDDIVGMPWQSVLAFLRIATSPKLPGERLAIEEAAEVADQWFKQPNVRLLAPREQHWAFLRRMIIDGQARGPLIAGAQLAALTIAFGGVLHTTDRDFARFPGLRWRNPLA